MDRALLRQLIIEQNSDGIFDQGILRESLPELLGYFRTNHAIVITGPRRVGKSTLLYQVLSSLKKEDFYYFAFDDERLVSFTEQDFALLYELFLELYGERKIFVFDEIQNVSSWERFVSRLQKKKYKFILTGSNAFLLSKEFSTFLTGRHLDLILLPFSFHEFLVLKNKLPPQEISRLSPSQCRELKHAFLEFFVAGGFPEYLKVREKEILKRLYEDIVLKDVVLRYNIREKGSLREIAFHLLSQVARPFSYTSLKNAYSVKNTTTVIDFLYYLEQTYLFFYVKKYSASLKVQSKSPQKVYCVDQGLVQVVAFRNSVDQGRILENIVYLHLRRKKGLRVYYYLEKRECDFLVKEEEKISQAIQVCYELNRENRDREVEGLFDAMGAFHLQEGLLLTSGQEETILRGTQRILVMPVWKWLLS